MGIKDALAHARSNLNAELKLWESPATQLLPTDPAHAASCLRLAFRHRHGRLAQSASKTLALFGEQLLWNGLLTFAATETAVHQSEPTLLILAARRDRAWRRRKGGLTRVASYLTAMLLRAPRAMDAIDLWRLSFDNTDKAPVSLQKLAAEAQTVRRGMWALLGYHQADHRNAEHIPEGLDRVPENRPNLAGEIASTVCRQVLAPQALMVPLVCNVVGGPAMPGWENENGNYLANLPTPTGHALPLCATIAKDTPSGRRAIREIIPSLPDLTRELAALALNEDVALEIVGELLERRDELACRNKSSLVKDLGKASRWSGVGTIGQGAARSVGLILDANWAAVSEIRSAHIPQSLIDFA